MSETPSHFYIGRYVCARIIAAEALWRKYFKLEPTNLNICDSIQASTPCTEKFLEDLMKKLFIVQFYGICQTIEHIAETWYKVHIPKKLYYFIDYKKISLKSQNFSLFVNL